MEDLQYFLCIIAGIRYHEKRASEWYVAEIQGWHQ